MAQFHQIDVSVNAPEAGVLKQLFAKEEDTVTVGQELAELDTEGKAEGGDKQDATSEPKDAASDKQETSSQPKGEQEQDSKAPAPKEETKKPEPPKEEKKPTPAPTKKEAEQPKKGNTYD